MPTATMLQTSGAYEYYTPPAIIEAARETMGGIDLDPASSAKANEIVKAEQYYTEQDDGMHKVWRGRIWMNHPFGRAEDACEPLTCEKEHEQHEHHEYPWYGNAAWIDKLFGSDYLAACCITYAATSEAWFKPLLYYPQCFLTPRTNYLLPDGSVKKGVQKGSVVTYLGDDVERFRRAFKALGVVKV